MQEIEFEHQKQLSQIQANYDLQKQSNQAAIDAGFKALNALFLINGAAATALLSQSNDDFKAAALLFAAGAFISIVTLGCAHFFCLAICSSFNIDYLLEKAKAAYAEKPDTNISELQWIPSPARGDGKSLSMNDIYWWRIKLAILAACSAIVFVGGLFYTSRLISL